MHTHFFKNYRSIATNTVPVLQYSFSVLLKVTSVSKKGGANTSLEKGLTWAGETA